MARSIDAFVALVGVLGALAGSAFAQLQPPAVNPVIGDDWGNTAMGTSALAINGVPHSTEGGSNNTASGYEALYSNLEGGNNVAYGYQALYESTASGNAAVGFRAMYNNKAGYHNAAFGLDALFANMSGNDNIALGYKAASNLITGSNNIDVGSPGGSSSENGTIRIGTLGIHTSAYLQGVYGVGASATPVFVDSSGQLTAPLSSERFKTGVATMGESSRKLDELRPVIFRYKTDASGTTQYGLIAEEVARVYPELVIRSADGRIDGVRYDQLAPMLLNELQQQRKAFAAQLEAQAQQLQEFQRQLAEMRDLKRQIASP